MEELQKCSVCEQASEMGVRTVRDGRVQFVCVSCYQRLRRTKTIRISNEVWDEIVSRGKFGETPDVVLRKTFGLPR